MGANLEITKKLQNYIDDFGLKLHPVQKEIIDYNNTLGDMKRMQVDPSQCHFLHLIIKISNIKNVLEIGTFTGLSALSILLALPDDGKLIALDKNEETNKIALNFFKKAKQDHKVKTIIKQALESLNELKNAKFDMVFIDADIMNYKEHEIGRAHVCTPVTFRNLVCRLLLEKKKKESQGCTTGYIRPRACARRHQPE